MTGWCEIAMSLLIAVSILLHIPSTCDSPKQKVEESSSDSKATKLVGKKHQMRFRL